MVHRQAIRLGNRGPEGLEAHLTSEDLALTNEFYVMAESAYDWRLEEATKKAPMSPAPSNPTGTVDVAGIEAKGRHVCGLASVNDFSDLLSFNMAVD